MTCGVCEAQNLVPNGDFEQGGCPATINGLDSVLFWFNPTISTPDYFNQCSAGGLYGADVPANYFGYQYANSGGGYCGLLCYHFLSSDYREYIEIMLTSALTANTCYHFEMYINAANRVRYATNAIGAYFSNTLVNFNNYLVIPYPAQINNSSPVITDTLNWTLVSGNYTATGGENYLLIGNFNNDSNTVVSLMNNSPLPFAYFYIDDVSLTPCTSIEEQNQNEAIKIYPNPFGENINIKVQGNELVEINFYDVTARKIFHQSFINSTSINTEQLAKGIYLYEVRNKNGVIKKGKVVKE